MGPHRPRCGLRLTLTAVQFNPFPRKPPAWTTIFWQLSWIEASGLSVSSSVNGEPVALHHAPCISFGIRASADASTDKANRAAIARGYLMAALYRAFDRRASSSTRRSRQLLAKAAIAASRTENAAATSCREGQRRGGQVTASISDADNEAYGILKPPKRAVVWLVNPCFTIAAFSSDILFTITVTGPGPNSTICGSPSPKTGGNVQLI